MSKFDMQTTRIDWRKRFQRQIGVSEYVLNVVSQELIVLDLVCHPQIQNNLLVDLEKEM